MINVEGIDYVTVPVTNLEKSVEFYSDLFDFELTEKRDNVFAFITLYDYKLKLLKVAQPMNALALAGIPLVSFIMDVDDFTEAISEIEERSLKIARGPESNDKGEFFYLADPDGNLLELSYLS